MPPPLTFTQEDAIFLTHINGQLTESVTMLSQQNNALHDRVNATNKTLAETFIELSRARKLLAEEKIHSTDLINIQKKSDSKHDTRLAAELSKRTQHLSKEIETLRSENEALRAENKRSRSPPSPSAGSGDDTYLADLAVAIFGNSPSLPSPPPPSSVPSPDTETHEFEVDTILDHRNVEPGVMSGEYLVKWKIDGSHTWEPWTHLNALEVFKDYYAAIAN